jgi:UDPglucose 6-dehydrogenase
MVWGLTYKAGTDTLRRSLSVELIDWLLGQGVYVQVYDPAVKELPVNWANRVKKCASAHENLEEMQVLVVGTEWPQFKNEARILSEFAQSNLLIIDPNRHLQGCLGDADFPYLSVGSRQLI